jgi:hypothetical protein
MQRLYRDDASKVLSVVKQMMSDGDSSEFNFKFLRDRRWKVVPVESAARLPADDIARLVAVLETTTKDCVAITTEQDMEPLVFRLNISEADFSSCNKELGALRFLLTDYGRTWAISCTEWYNLFGATPDLLADMLGTTIEQARTEYMHFAEGIATGPNEPLVEIGRQYSKL